MARVTVRTLAAVALLVVAGCGGAAPDPGQSVGTTPADRPTRTPAATTTPANPWGEATVTVAVANRASPWRNVTRLVRDAASYWDAHADEYGAYAVRFAVDADAPDPDLVVRLVNSTAACGGGGDGAVGYAPVLTPGDDVDRPESVCVRAGLADSATREVLAHEFGHVLGVGHDDPPQPLMAPTLPRLPIPRPGPSVREHAWRDDTLGVYVDVRDVFARRRHVVLEQLNHTLDYFERGADGALADPPTFAFVDSRAAADVVFRWRDTSPCGNPERGTCGRLAADAAGGPQFVFTATNVHEDVVGWYFAYWLAWTFDPDHLDDLPPAVTGASYDQRRAAWWNRSAPEFGT